MARALRSFRGPVLLIGSDIPTVTTAHIARAFRLLGASPSVLGPTPDGGFWLVGLRHPSRTPTRLFRNVRWSHPRTREETLKTLPHPVGVADQLSDVDSAKDLDSVIGQ